MGHARYVALLRGINVGGGNIIRMAALRACFEAGGLENVATYIQSGNVLFETAETDPGALARRLERTLSRRFSPYKARIVVCSQARLRQIVREAPRGFGSRPQTHRYDVIFLRPPLTAAQALTSITTRPGVDRVFAGPDVLYFSRVTARAALSHLARIVALPAYQDMTIRSWKTTTALLALMDGRAQG